MARGCSPSATTVCVPLTFDKAESSFNLLDTDSGLKVDVFVLGSSELDRRQIERRWRVESDAILRPRCGSRHRKTSFCASSRGLHLGEDSSARHVGLLRIQRDDLDWRDLRGAASLGLDAVLQRD